MTLNIPPLPDGTLARSLPEPTLTLTLTLTVRSDVIRQMRADITFNGRPCEVHISVGGISYPVTALSLQDSVYPGH